MRKGFTLIEVVVGSIILAVTFAGLLATFTAVRRYVKRANKRLIATRLAVTQLNELYREVKEDTWDSGTLQPGSINSGSYTIDKQVYPDGVVSVTEGEDYRRVSITINYPE